MDASDTQRDAKRRKAPEVAIRKARPSKAPNAFRLICQSSIREFLAVSQSPLIVSQ